MVFCNGNTWKLLDWQPFVLTIVIIVKTFDLENNRFGAISKLTVIVKGISRVEWICDKMFSYLLSAVRYYERTTYFGQFVTCDMLVNIDL